MEIKKSACPYDCPDCCGLLVYTEGDEVAKRKVKCLALVDLTQPQDVLDKVRDAVKEIQAVFSHKNLFVSDDSDYIVSILNDPAGNQLQLLLRYILRTVHIWLFVQVSCSTGRLPRLGTSVSSSP